MRIRIPRLCSLTLISLLSLFAFAAQSGAQDHIFDQLGGLSKMRGQKGNTYRAKVAVAAATTSYTYSVLYNFCSGSGCTDGSGPIAGLIRDAAGNLYGTTIYGGANNSGTVFKVDSSGQETVLYSFCSASNCADGATPRAGLIRDAAGNLYGTTAAGGNLNGANCIGGSPGCGTVFKLDTTGHETVLYSFCSASNCTDGANPDAGLIQDSAGNLYGTTEVGGANAFGHYATGGTVFKVDSTGHETVLYNFCSASGCTDGNDPRAGLILDAAGNLYGTTYQGGASASVTGCGIACGYGTVFKVDSTGHETVLYSFCSVSNPPYYCTDGKGPQASLIQDSAGNLYGTTVTGGGGDPNATGGTVFKVDTSGHETVLYSFCSVLQDGSCTDGLLPQAGLIRDAAGNLYGTTQGGGTGANYGSGTVFKVDNTGHETVLYSFCSVGGANCTDGYAPDAGLIQDDAGNLYGTTGGGGANSYYGTVFKLSPLLPTPTVTVTPSSSSITTVQAVNVTVAVSGGSGNPTPTGTVTLSSGSYSSGAKTLSSGSATINIPAGSLAVGTDMLTGSYSGDSNYHAAIGTSSVTVQPPSGTLPSVSTAAATSISGSGATIYGLANANGTSATVWFEWGTSSSLVSFTQCTSLAISGTATTYESCALTGLTSGTIYYYRIAASNSSGTVKGSILNFTAQARDTSGALQFVAMTPCRVADTRNATGPFGGPSLGAKSTRNFVIPSSSCGIPAVAAAYSLNVTVVPHGGLGYLTVWPSEQAQPLVSTLNSIDGRIKANAAIVPAGTGGAISVYVTDATDVVLDINGYFLPGPVPSGLAFYPLTPCRVADTRLANAPLGGPYLVGGQSRTLPILSSSCQIPASAQAYSLNFTAVPRGSLGFLSAWPAGQTWAGVSTLNAPTGTVTANAAIVPAGSSGAINVMSATGSNTDVVIDINGYFAPAAAGGLSLYTVTPCRVVDTRSTSGAFKGTLAVDVKDSSCGVLPSAQAFVLNATVVPAGPTLGYLTLWPNGQTQPLVSTLNALDGMVTSNMAIVPTANGEINAYSTDATQLVLDVNGYVAP